MSRRERWIVAAGVLLAAGLAAVALATIMLAGWRDPFADQWRMLPDYLTRPFPDNVLFLENGHRPILPGLVRVAELAWLGGGQALQLAIGALAALATVLLLARIALTDRSVDAGRRALAVALIAGLVFWLGNGRYLLHGNESVHGYLLTACLAGALALLTTAQAPGAARVAGAAVLALLATFCFGPGLAAFGALVMLALIQRRPRVALALAAAAGLTLALYLLLPAADGVRGVIAIRPLATAQLAAAWLASLWIHLLQPVLDVEASHALPGLVARAAAPFAAAWESRFGDVWRQHGLATLVGAIGIGYLLAASVRSWRDRDGGRLRLTGLGLAWFALGVAGLVALARLDYFAVHPDQLLAQRYLPWSCLFWLGLLLAALAAPGAAPHAGRAVAARRAIAPALAVFALAAIVVSTPMYRGWGARTQDNIALQAVGVAVGVLDSGLPLWETQFEHIPPARELLQARSLAMFAWPETRALAGVAPNPQAAAPAARLTLTLRPIGNRFGGEAVAVTARGIDASATSALPRRLLLQQRDGPVVGLMIHQRGPDGRHHAGYLLPGVAGTAGLRVLAAAGDGFACVANC